MNLDDIKQLIANEALESAELEFKAADALSKIGRVPADIIKDISAMANGAGGIIVYGVGELGERGSRYAGALSPIIDPAITADWLGQVISARTSPPLQGVKIDTLNLEGGAGRIFVVEIEQGRTAHQSAFDNVYYQRVGTQALPMTDFQVRDVMNRRAAPLLNVVLDSQRATPTSLSPGHVLNVFPRIENIGTLSIDRWKLQVAVDEIAYMEPSGLLNMQYINKKVIRDNYRQEGRQYARFTYSSQLLITVGMNDLHPGEVLTLYDGMNFPPIGIRVHPGGEDRLRERAPPLKWRLFMANSKPTVGEVPFGEWFTL